MGKMKKKSYRMELLKELAERVEYWSTKDSNYMNAYLVLLHSFSQPEEETNKIAGNE